MSGEGQGGPSEEGSRVPVTPILQRASSLKTTPLSRARSPHRARSPQHRVPVISGVSGQQLTPQSASSRRGTPLRKSSSVNLGSQNSSGNLGRGGAKGKRNHPIVMMLFLTTLGLGGAGVYLSLVRWWFVYDCCRVLTSDVGDVFLCCAPRRIILEW